MVVVARETRPSPEEAAPDVLIDREERGEPCSQILGAEGQQELSPEQRELALEHRFARPARGTALVGSYAHYAIAATRERTRPPHKLPAPPRPASSSPGGR